MKKKKEMQVKLLLVTFYLNGGLHAVTIGKSSEWMSNRWTIRFLKNDSEPNFGFPYISTWNQSKATVVTVTIPLKMQVKYR